MEEINTNKIFVGKPDGWDRFRALGVDGRIILENILGK
jgi:hypothetical protein